MKDWFGRGIWFLVGMFLVIMGLYFLIHPDAALVSIAWLLGAAMLVSGASDLVVYLARHRAYIASGWFLADGIIDLLLGLLFVCNSWLAAELLPYAFIKKPEILYTFDSTGCEKLKKHFIIRKIEREPYAK